MLRRWRVLVHFGYSLYESRLLLTVLRQMSVCCAYSSSSFAIKNDILVKSVFFCSSGIEIIMAKSHITDPTQIFLHLDEDTLYMVTTDYLSAKDLHHLKQFIPEIFTEHKYLEDRVKKYEAENPYVCRYCGDRCEEYLILKAHIGFTHAHKILSQKYLMMPISGKTMWLGRRWRIRTCACTAYLRFPIPEMNVIAHRKNFY